MNCLAVFDLGGTHLRTALADRQGLTGTQIVDTDAARPVEQLIESLRRFSHTHELRAVVGGVPGYIDPAAGTVMGPPNLPALNGIALSGLLSEEFGVPVHLRNDTALVGLGEAREGAGRGLRSVAYLTVSTGVNAAYIHEGRILEGRGGAEIGRTVIGEGPEGLVTLEQLTGGASFRKHYKKEPAELKDPVIWEREAHLVSIGIRNLILHWMPEAVVLGGSMMRDIPIASLRTSLSDLERTLGWLPELLPGRLGSTGGLSGALELARQNDLLR